MFGGHYEDWRKSRIATTENIIKRNLFSNKTILEVGCGYADIGMHFATNYNSRVTCVDARKEYIDHIRNTSNSVIAYVCDCDGDLHELQDSKYDLIIHWGVLYHIKDPANHLEKILKKTDYILLETEVCDSDNNILFTLPEKGYDQAYNGVGSRPSAKYVEDCIDNNGFVYKMIKTSALNSGYHTYDWETSNTMDNRNGLRRFWVAWRADVETPLA